MIKKLTKEEFSNLLNEINTPKYVDHNKLYKVYDMTIEGIVDLVESNVLSNIEGINNISLVQYILGEFIYSVKLSKENYETYLDDDKNVELIASISADKYLTFNLLNKNERTLTNKYLPPISTLDLYLNFMLSYLKNNKNNDQAISLIADLLSKSISISRCSINELVNGYETEAFSIWRTLHECECTLVLLSKYAKKLIPSYLTHMKYGIAFKNGINNKSEQDNIFIEIKEKMRLHNLKSKDMKKFIEYGWLYDVPTASEDLKLNFRDGLEKLAGLEEYSSRYMDSSEIIHSTPLLIYSNREYFYFITLLSLYESFFRLEKSFVTLFAKKVSKENLSQYLRMRNLYYSSLVNLYKDLSLSFVNWQKKVAEKVKN